MLHYVLNLVFGLPTKAAQKDNLFYTFLEVMTGLRFAKAVCEMQDAEDAV